jgi:predicted PurR-regulated permease PerM
VALVQGSNTLASSLGPALLAVGINLVFVAFVTEVIPPKIEATAANLPVVVSIPGVVVGAAIAGPLGALIVLPLIGLCTDLVGYTVHKIRGGDPYPDETEPVCFEELPWSWLAGI